MTDLIAEVKRRFIEEGVGVAHSCADLGVNVKEVLPVFKSEDWRAKRKEYLATSSAGGAESISVAADVMELKEVRETLARILGRSLEKMEASIDSLKPKDLSNLSKVMDTVEKQLALREGRATSITKKSVEGGLSPVEYAKLLRKLTSDIDAVTSEDVTQ